MMNSDFVVEYVNGHHSLREYFDHLLSDERLDQAWAGCPELADTWRKHLWSAFVEMDTIPRSDVFWRNTNMRTTFTKVGEFYAKNADPQLSDPEGAWRAFAVAGCRGDDSLFFRAATVLYRLGQLGVRPFVRLSYNVGLMSGWEIDEPLVNALVEFDAVGSARTYLDELKGSSENYLPEWAAKVLQRLPTV